MPLQFWLASAVIILCTVVLAHNDPNAYSAAAHGALAGVLITLVRDLYSHLDK
jgi:hypothetical protein